MPVTKYYSIPLIGGKSFTTEESDVEVAFFAFQNYRQFFEFCRINGSARIHTSINLKERIMLHASYLTSILLLRSLTEYPITVRAKMQYRDSPPPFFFDQVMVKIKTD